MAKRPRLASDVEREDDRRVLESRTSHSRGEPLRGRDRESFDTFRPLRECSERRPRRERCLPLGSSWLEYRPHSILHRPSKHVNMTICLNRESFPVALPSFSQRSTRLTPRRSPRCSKHSPIRRGFAFSASLRRSQEPRPASVTSLSRLVSQPTVSHHLKVLNDAGLLEREKRRTWVFYRIAPKRMEAIRAALAAPAPERRKAKRL